MKFRRQTMILGTALFLAATGTAFGAEDLEKLQQKLLVEQCNLCHSGHRIYQIDPKEIATVVERMRKMNPDWFLELKSEHMVEAIAAILKDPSMVATREAWAAAVERGSQIFADTSLGKNGYNCRACHNPPEVLRNIADAYPRWDPKLKRFVDFNDAINRMIVEKLGGDPLPITDQKLYDLVVYLKTL